MRIAFIGWGSLPKNPKGLQISSEWFQDGPYLPVEFARISKGKRLTLVLFPRASPVQTLWALTKYRVLDEAIEALAEREQTSTGNIGYYSLKDNTSHCTVVPELLGTITNWIKEKKLDAIVWTDLPSNFGELTENPFNEENVLDYLTDLPAEERETAQKYVIETPEQIDTPIRRYLKVKLGWRSLTEYRNGFWLNKNLFVTSDDAIIQNVSRKNEMTGHSEQFPMLILTNAVELTLEKTK